VDVAQLLARSIAVPAAVADGSGSGGPEAEGPAADGSGSGGSGAA
jgi:hypothetical protein